MREITKIEKPDMVNHPPHYANGTKNFECIEIMQEMFGQEAIAHYSIINAFKYIWRSGEKGNDDLSKAEWYLKKYKELAGCKCPPDEYQSIYKLLEKKVEKLNGNGAKR